jgi:hypothetical protein
MRLDEKLGKALFFCSGTLVGGYSHARMMLDTTLVASYLPLTYVPEHLAVVFLAMLACAMTGSVLLVVTGWWRSVYRDQWQPLLTVTLTCVSALAVVRAVSIGHGDAAWLALLLIGLVLYAGIDSARALRRELRPSTVKPERRAF